MTEKAQCNLLAAVLKLRNGTEAARSWHVQSEVLIQGHLHQHTSCKGRKTNSLQGLRRDRREVRAARLLLRDAIDGLTLSGSKFAE